MKNLFSGAPWPASTIAIISILFTPAVGGIVAGINQRRFGHPELAWREFLISLLAFAWVLLYALFIDQRVELGPFFPLTLFYAVVTAPRFTPYLVIPFAALACLIVILQRRSWQRRATIAQSSWWSAFLFGAGLTILIGYAMFIVLGVVDAAYR